MIEVLTSFLSIPMVALATAIVLVLLIATVVWLFVYAMLKGRDVTFWPPKIGPALHPSNREQSSGSQRIEGYRLFQHKGYYPIDIAPLTNQPSLNSTVYVKALNHLLYEVHDRLAAMDLVYLREANLDEIDVLPREHSADYDKLVKKYDLQSFRKNHRNETDHIFRNVYRIVEDLGDTLRGTSFEIVLHDVRNPLRSVLAVKNTEGISDRRVGDPSTRFVVQYLRFQGEHLIALESVNKVAYPKQFFKTKTVKATTTPLFDEQYGLVGILCFNIDIEAINSFGEEKLTKFCENYTRTYGETPEFEKDLAPSAQ